MNMNKIKQIDLKKINEREFNLLIIDDEQGMCNSLKDLLENNNFNVHTANSARDGLKIIQYSNIDLIICDIVMPDMGGLLFLSKIGNKLPVIMMTAYASIDSARKAFKLGACDYLVKPFEFDELLVLINQNLKIAADEETSKPDHIFLRSKNSDFLKVLSLAEKFSKTDMPILICGESGTGKEVLADYIYRNSARNCKPFVKINCAAIPETLLESELFGYEKGAFTGAQSRKIGKFEEADGGTILLDEIGDMDLMLQAKLLRVLQDFKFYRVGGKEVINLDTRLICASNRDLKKLIEEKQFRSDLYHRIHGVYLSVPPLRDRVEDIEDLCRFFTERFNKKYGKNIKHIDNSIIKILQEYEWPGNIRELKNCMERAVVICEGNRLIPEHLPDSIIRKKGEKSKDAGLNFSEQMEKYRSNYMRKVIIDALKKSNGNRIEAARLLNISRKTLYNWMKNLEIKYDFF